MRFFRAFFVLVPPLILSGCGYVHFGRLPESASAVGDGTGTTAYANLALEHKMLQQELVLARKEGAALRTALESQSADGSASPELAARLNETSRELAALRASYAKLMAGKSPDAKDSAPADPTAQARLSKLEEQLAASLRNYTALQQENTRLRTEVDTTRAENTTLAAQVKTVTERNTEAQAALAQLNRDFLLQKEARTRAEQQTAAAHAQLNAVLAQRNESPPALTSARETTADSAATLRVAAAPPTEAPATAELRASPDRLQTTTPSTPPLAATPAPGTRIHVVVEGDTLEKIAQKYYGDAKRWTLLYSVNNAILSGNRPLKPGMKLEIPTE